MRSTTDDIMASRLLKAAKLETNNSFLKSLRRE
jgi:hypothetical protein